MTDAALDGLLHDGADRVQFFKPPAGKAWDGWRFFDTWQLSPDLICSLGGDCIAASQVKLRGLRPFSLPFDWCFSDGAVAIEKIAEMFKEGFVTFARKENLVPIPGLRFAYKDKLTGYNFMHHFKAPIEHPGEYERFDEILKRRLARLIKAINLSGSILFLVSRTWKIDERCLFKVVNECSLKWPGKSFKGVLLTYNSSPGDAWHNDKVGVIRVPRDRTSYDMKEKAFEWSFLDAVRYSDSAKRMHAALLDGEVDCHESHLL